VCGVVQEVSRFSLLSHLVKQVEPLSPRAHFELGTTLWDMGEQDHYFLYHESKPLINTIKRSMSPPAHKPVALWLACRVV
jgi:hypothetical protein